MALVPTDISFNDFVRERSLIPEDDQENQVEAGGVATTLFTPLGASAQYYSKPKNWARFLRDEPTSGLSDLSRVSIVRSLFRLTSRFNDELLASLGSADPAKRTLARSAFQCTEERPGRTDFYHGLVLSMTFDKFSWALNLSDDGTQQVDNRPLQTPIVAESEIPKTIEKVYELYEQWPETVSTFAGHWIRVKDAVEMQPTVLPNESSTDTTSEEPSLYNTSKQKLRGILGTLVDGVQETDSMMQIALVENNFCLAAIGLFALFLRDEHVNTHGKDAPPKSLADLLSEVHNDLPDMIKNLHDYDLLRPLYALGAVSPLLLLSHLQITISGRNRVPLYGLAQMIRHRALLPDWKRSVVEQRLLNIVLDMAVEGRSVFKRLIGNAVDDWRALHVLNSEYSCIATVKMLDWRAEYQRRVDENSTDVVIINHITSSLAAMGKKKRIKAINLYDKNPGWFTEALRTSASKPNSMASSKLPSSNPSGSTGQHELSKNQKPQLGSPRGQKRPVRSESSSPETVKRRRKGSKDMQSDLPPILRDSNTVQAFFYSSDDDMGLSMAKNGKNGKVLNDGKEKDEKFKQQSSETVGSSEDIAGSEEESVAFDDARLKKDRVMLKPRPLKPVFKLPQLFDQHRNQPHGLSFLQVRCPVPYALFNEEPDEDHNPDGRAADPLSNERGNFVYDWVWKSFLLPKWNALDGRLNFIAQHDKVKKPTGRSEIREVVTIYRQVFDKMTEDEKRHVYRRHHIHVSGRPREALYGIDGWGSPNIQAIVDCSMLRECHDNTISDAEKGRRSASLVQVTKKREVMLSYREKWTVYQADQAQRLDSLSLPADHPLKLKDKSSPRKYAPRVPKGNTAPFWCLNFVDIPLIRSMPTVLFDDLSRFILNDQKDYTWQTRLGTKATLASQWLSAALQSSTSDWHSDAGALDTFVHVAAGRQYWVICEAADVEVTKQGWQCEKAGFDSVILEEGDDLYMHGDTPHLVTTLDDSICLGGHYFCVMHFRNVAYGMVHEHFYGDKITNTEHTRVPLLLMKGLCAFLEEYCRKKKDKLGYRMPAPEDLCWLIAVVMHLDRLAPLLPKGVTEQLWQATPQFNADFKYAKEKAKAFAEKLNKAKHDDMMQGVCRRFQELVHPLNCVTKERAVKIRCFCTHGGHAELSPSVDEQTQEPEATKKAKKVQEEEDGW